MKNGGYTCKDASTPCGIHPGCRSSRFHRDHQHHALSHPLSCVIGQHARHQASPMRALGHRRHGPCRLRPYDMDYLTKHHLGWHWHPRFSCPAYENLPHYRNHEYTLVALQRPLSKNFYVWLPTEIDCSQHRRLNPR